MGGCAGYCGLFRELSWILWMYVWDLVLNWVGSSLPSIMSEVPIFLPESELDVVGGLERRDDLFEASIHSCLRQPYPIRYLASS